MPNPSLPTNLYTLLEADVPTTVVNQAVATGVAKSYIFTVPPSKDSNLVSVTFVPRQVGGVTALTCTLLAASDGATYNAFTSAPASLALITASALTPVTVTNLVPGMTYKVTIGTLTGGTNVSVDAFVS